MVANKETDATKYAVLVQQHHANKRTSLRYYFIAQ